MNQHPFAYANRRRVLTIAEIQAAGGYSTILADPPWSYDDNNARGAAEHHYTAMTFSQLCDLPIQYIASPNCALFLWATYPKIHDALNLIPMWGFKYKSFAFDWVKISKGGHPRIGNGRWTRNGSEICLLATRGHPQRQDRGVRQLLETFVQDNDAERILYSPRGGHSAKPSEVRDRIVQLMGDLPRIELFARERAPGWDAWGNQIDSDVVLT